MGMDYCLRQAAVVGLLDFDDVYIYPIEEGSVKTTLVYVKKNPWKVVERTSYVATILSTAIFLIGNFGAGNFKIPTKEILDAVSDRKVLELCRGYEFRKSLQKVAQPVSEYNETAKIIIGEKTIEINCDNKYDYYVGKENEKILPELVNGETVDLEGQIFRINTDTNDLGFKYKGRRISVSPINEEESTAQFHQFLELKKVKIKGVVIRESEYEVPSIKVIKITEEDQLNLFNTKEVSKR